jgi:hypothetical protein
MEQPIEKFQRLLRELFQFDDDGRRYLVYRGRIDHRQIAVI